MDLVAHCVSLPCPGETLTCTSFEQVFGGKGANPAIAASRAGGIVSMIGRVGEDAFAERLRDNLLENGINCDAAEMLHQRGAKVVAITLGKQGTLVFDGANMQRVETIAVDAVDTTGAGDAFAGALAVRWSETQDLIAAIRWANIAGALAASRHGAQAGIALRMEIENRWATEHAT